MQTSVIIEAPARLDGLNSGDFTKFVSTIVTAGARQIVLDLSALQYLSSAGIRALMILQKEINARQGKLALVFCRPAIRDVLNLCGLLNLAPFAESLEAARKHVR
jgi:stage II sporulation protein AA (anti-sigma F factor antagonist)